MLLTHGALLKDTLITDVFSLQQCYLFVCLTFVLLQLSGIESLLPLLFLCSLTFSSELKIFSFLFAIDQIIHSSELV